MGEKPISQLRTEKKSPPRRRLTFNFKSTCSSALNSAYVYCLSLHVMWFAQGKTGVRVFDHDSPKRVAQFSLLEAFSVRAEMQYTGRKRIQLCLWVPR